LLVAACELLGIERPVVVGHTTARAGGSRCSARARIALQRPCELRRRDFGGDGR
jgi:hypothetical protein